MYWDYYKFSNNEFSSIINTKNDNLQNSNDSSLRFFMNVCKEVLDQVAPLKQKYIRANNGPFINKDITKAVTKRASLRNNYLKNGCDANRKAHYAQRNPCVSLIRKTKLDYHNKLKDKKVADNERFLEAVSHFLKIMESTTTGSCCLKKMRPFHIIMKYLKNQ